MQLRADAAIVPGVDSDTKLVAVSRTPILADNVIAITAEDLLQ